VFLVYLVYMKELLTIKEFSKLSGIEQTTLRYWDDIGLFSPAKRDPENNYRYYSPQQIIAVNFITVLSELNIPLKTISEMEQERTPERIVRLIASQEMQLDMEMRKLRERYSIIHIRRELINYGIKLCDGFTVVDGIRVDDEMPTEEEGLWIDTSEIAVLRRENKAFILGPRNHWKSGEPFYEYFMNFCNMADELRMNLSFPIGGYHDDMESFLRAPGEPDFFFSIDPTGNRRREAGKYLVGFCRGYYGELGDVADRMAVYAEENALTLHGPVFTMYLLDEICMRDPDQYLAQICVAVL